MTSEHAFLRERLDIVEHWLATAERQQFVYEGKGRVRQLLSPPIREDLTRKREARLLRKLLSQTKEGQVLRTLEAWKGQLRTFMAGHRQQYKEMQDAYDAWWQLPLYQRERLPRPPEPPPPRYVDADGAPWIVDDRFLALFDDLIVRLQNPTRETQTVTLASAFPIREAWIAAPAEATQQQVSETSPLQVTLDPYQILTLRLKVDPFAGMILP